MSESIVGYEEYVVAAAEGRTEDAKRHLLVALRDARDKGARPVVSGLIQRLGTLLHSGGDRNAALALYEVSQDVDEGSLLAMLEYAKFLWNEANEPELAKQKCREIIQRASSHPFPESESDFSSEQYTDAAKRLVQEIEDAHK